jgi:uncharacterized membrane protein
VTVYTISQALWGLAGLVVGFVLGRFSRTAAVTADPDIPKGIAMPARATRADNLIGIIVAGLAVISVVVAAFTITRQQNAVECQTTFNLAFTDALTQRTEAATEERAAQRTLLTTQATTPEERRAGLDRYLQALDRADNRREENPLPLRPRC